MKKIPSLVSCAAALLFSFHANAWTSKPVKMLVPAPAGGTMDIVARILADQLSADMGQPVIVENKPGAGGAIAVQAMMSAPQDGQSIMVTASNVLTEIPHVMKTSFDPLKDIKPVATVASATMVLVGAPNLPAKNVKELIAYAKSKPGTLSFASYSAGTSSHYAGMILNKNAGLDLQHIPFPGSPPALAQVMGGQIPIMFDGMATSLPQVKAGKLQIYGVASKVRSTHLPQVPTLAEEGLTDIEFGNWIGVVVSSGVANDITDKINAAVLKAADAPKVKTRLVGAGFEPNIALSASQLQQSVRMEFERNALIVNNFKIQLNP
jgi:tripartite-type tricarboxylate transporter receptor subunit TctC